MDIRLKYNEKSRLRFISITQIQTHLSIVERFIQAFYDTKTWEGY